MEPLGKTSKIPDRLVIAEELTAMSLFSKGMNWSPLTCLHVPSIGLVVAGDAAYNDVLLYLAESNAQTRPGVDRRSGQD